VCGWGPNASSLASARGSAVAEARLHQRGLARQSGTFDLAGEGAEAVGLDLGDDDPQAGRGGQRRSDRRLLAVLGRKCDREPEGGVVVPHHQAGRGDRDAITLDDIALVNSTMRSRSEHAHWLPTMDADQGWLSRIPDGRKRVERLMREARISGMVRRKRGRTTISVPGGCESPTTWSSASSGPLARTSSGSPM